MELRDRIALVTGGGRGIGRGITLTLAKEGADVVIGDINRHNADTVAREAEALGRRALAYQLDVRQNTTVDEVFAQVLDEFGRIDILINNAGDHPTVTGGDDAEGGLGHGACGEPDRRVPLLPHGGSPDGDTACG